MLDLKKIIKKNSAQSEAANNTAKARKTPPLNPESQTPPQPQKTEDQSETQSSNFSHSPEVDYFDEWIGEGQQAEFVEAVSSGDILSQDEFHEAWCGLTQFGSMITGLESLADQEGDKTAKSFTDAVYNRCSGNRYLEWLIKPQSGWMPDMMTIGFYVMAKRKMIRDEIKLKRGTKAQPKQAASKPHSNEEGAPNSAQLAMLTGQ